MEHQHVGQLRRIAKNRKLLSSFSRVRKSSTSSNSSRSSQVPTRSSAHSQSESLVYGSQTSFEYEGGTDTEELSKGDATTRVNSPTLAPGTYETDDELPYSDGNSHFSICTDDEGGEPALDERTETRKATGSDAYREEPTGRLSTTDSVEEVPRATRIWAEESGYCPKGLLDSMKTLFQDAPRRSSLEQDTYSESSQSSDRLYRTDSGGTYRPETSGNSLTSAQSVYDQQAVSQQSIHQEPSLGDSRGAFSQDDAPGQNFQAPEIERENMLGRLRRRFDNLLRRKHRERHQAKTSSSRSRKLHVPKSVKNIFTDATWGSRPSNLPSEYGPSNREHPSDISERTTSEEEGKQATDNGSDRLRSGYWSRSQEADIPLHAAAPALDPLSTAAATAAVKPTVKRKTIESKKIDSKPVDYYERMREFDFGFQSTYTESPQEGTTMKEQSVEPLNKACAEAAEAYKHRGWEAFRAPEFVRGVP